MVRLTDMDADVFDWLNGDVRTLRRAYERVRTKPIPDDAAWLDMGRVRVLRFPCGAPPTDAAIVYFHGGGFIVGSPATHADITARLARHTGLPVYSVDYRLAPEHPAPAPAEDGITVISHLVRSGTRRLAICGDSAGGAVALAAHAGLPDALRDHVVGVASFYGAYGLLDTSSMAARGSRVDGTDRACVARYFRLAGGDAYSIEALALPSPVPVYLLAAEEDPLRDDTLLMAQAMEACGRPVTIDRVVGADHGFLHGEEGNPPAESAAARFAAWLSRITSA